MATMIDCGLEETVVRDDEDENAKLNRGRN